MARPTNAATVSADHGTSYQYLYSIGRTWNILLIPLLYSQIVAHPINTSTV